MQIRLTKFQNFVSLNCIKGVADVKTIMSFRKSRDRIAGESEREILYAR
jgi:hypothetical protein